VALELAREKALDVLKRHPNAWVIGCDQVLDCEGALMTKPADVEMARIQLKTLRGRTHRLCTAVAVAHAGRVMWECLEAPRLTMWMFDDQTLDVYMSAASDALRSPGAYHLEGSGAALFEHVDGDFNTVLGLPLGPLLQWLRGQRGLAA
jgi:septum formation protein